MRKEQSLSVWSGSLGDGMWDKNQYTDLGTAQKGVGTEMSRIKTDMIDWLSGKRDWEDR